MGLKRQMHLIVTLPPTVPSGKSVRVLPAKQMLPWLQLTGPMPATKTAF